MKTNYKNRQLKTESSATEREYMFPKANGRPVTIRAKSRAEAEKKLKDKEASS